MCAEGRPFGGQIHGRLRELPAFFRVLTAPEICDIVGALTGSDLFRLTEAANSVRVDRPDEDRFIFDRHQDYPTTCCRGTR